MLGADLHFAFRTMWKRPAFSAFAIGVMAVGAGAATAIFSYADAILFKALEIPDAGRTVSVTQIANNDHIQSVTPAVFHEWQTKNTVFEDLAGWSYGTGFFNLTGIGFAERIRGVYVTPNYFAFMGTRLAAGRSFAANDSEVAVINHWLMRRRFESAGAAIGQVLILNQKPHVVIGVLGAEGPMARGTTDVYLQMPAGPNLENPQFSVIYAKLGQGVSIQQATAGLTSLLKPAKEPLSVELKYFRDEAIRESHRKTAWILLGAVALLLFTACANVANILLAQMERRRKEAATRLALGASRGRLTQQFLTESLALAGIGAAGGVLVAQWLVKILPTMTPAGIVPTEVFVEVDGRVLAFSIGLALLTGLAAGLAPAVRLSGRKPTGPRDRFRSALLIVEVALTFILVMGSALLMRSFNNLMTIDAGFQRDGLITFKTEFDAGRYPTAAALSEFQTTLLDRLRMIPMVASAGYTISMPLGDSYTMTSFTFQGSARRFNSADVHLVSENYPATIGLTLLRGSPLSAQAPVLVNQTFVRKYLNGLEPLGRTLSSGMFKKAPLMIAGVVADVRSRTLDHNPEPEVYVLASQAPLDYIPRHFHFVLNTAADPASQIPAVQAAVASLDRSQPLFDVRTMNEVVARSVAGPRFRAILFGWFGGLALLISAAGIFGVLHSLVAQRTHEIGIRMALGAGGGDLIGWVVRQGMTRVIAGVLLGLAGSLAATRVLENYLFGIKPNDVITFIATAAVIVTAGLAATWIPARRAARVNPIVALRAD
jgi:putative ABC transport system permease protein